MKVKHDHICSALLCWTQRVYFLCEISFTTHPIILPEVLSTLLFAAQDQSDDHTEQTLLNTLQCSVLEKRKMQCFLDILKRYIKNLPRKLTFMLFRQ